MFSLNDTWKKMGRSGDGKRNNLLGWPYSVLFQFQFSLLNQVYLIEIFVCYYIMLRIVQKE